MLQAAHDTAQKETTREIQGGAAVQDISSVPALDAVLLKLEGTRCLRLTSDCLWQEFQTSCLERNSANQ